MNFNSEGDITFPDISRNLKILVQAVSTKPNFQFPGDDLCVRKFLCSENSTIFWLITEPLHPHLLEWVFQRYVCFV